jgi:hypothetical protein
VVTRNANPQEKGHSARLASDDGTDWAGTSQSVSPTGTIASAITRPCHAVKKPIAYRNGARAKARKEALGPFNLVCRLSLNASSEQICVAADVYAGG